MELKAFCNGYEVVAAASEDEARAFLATADLGYEPEDIDGDGWTVLPNDKEVRSEDSADSVQTVGALLGAAIGASGGKPAHLWSCAQ